MAIWQFDFSLVPKAAVVAFHGCVPDSLDGYAAFDLEEEFDLDSDYPNYWEGGVSHQVVQAVRERLPLRRSWSEEAEMYGDERGTSVEIWSDDVNCRVDARSSPLPDLEFFAQLACDAECLIVLKGTGSPLEPSLLSLRCAFKASRAYRFCKDPIGTLHEL